MTDEITLTLPREPEFHRVAHLVLGGLAVRLDEPAFGVARGQAAVLYDEDVVVGSGLVTD